MNNYEGKGQVIVLTPIFGGFKKLIHDQASK